MLTSHFKSTVLMCIISTSALIISSCDNKPEPEPGPDSVNLEVQESVGIPSEGGPVTVSYTITGSDSQDGVTAQCAAPWIHDIDCSVYGTITLNADSNSDTSSREAVLDIAYGDIRKEVLLRQTGTELQDFTLDFTDVQYTSFSVSVKPLDQEMTYSILTTETDLFRSFVDDEAVIAYVTEEWTKNAADSEMTLEQYLATLLKQGDLSGSFSWRYPGTSYTVFIFGVTTDLEVLTDVYSWEVTTVSPELLDIDYTITPEVNGANATVHTVPGDMEQPYYLNVFETSSISDTGDDAVGFWQNYLIDLTHLYYQVYGQSPEEVLAPYIQTGESDATFTLSPETAYTAVAMAATEQGLVLSDISSAEFTTGNVSLSDNIITIEAWMNADDDLWFDIYTTNDDPYAWGVTFGNDVEGMTKDEMFEYIKAYPTTGMNVTSGYFPGGVGVVPGNTYVVWAFGYENGTATTDLTYCRILAKEGETASSDDFTDAASTVIPAAAAMSGITGDRTLSSISEK